MPHVTVVLTLSGVAKNRVPECQLWYMSCVGRLQASVTLYVNDASLLRDGLPCSGTSWGLETRRLRAVGWHAGDEFGRQNAFDAMRHELK